MTALSVWPWVPARGLTPLAGMTGMSGFFLIALPQQSRHGLEPRHQRSRQIDACSEHEGQVRK